MGYLIIFNVVAAAQFVGPGCTGLFQPSNSYYRGEPRGDDEGIFVGRGKERQPTSPSHAKEYASDIHPPEMCGCMPHTVERSPTRRSLTHMCDPYKSRPIRCQSGRARPAGRSNLHSSKTKAARGNGRDMKLE